MKRRDFIAGLGGAAATWPLVARAQQPGGVRPIGVQIGQAESDRQGQAFVAAFRDELRKLGWTEGGNIRIDTRWATAGDAEARQRFHAIAIAKLYTNFGVCCERRSMDNAKASWRERPHRRIVAIEFGTCRSSTRRRRGLPGWAYRTRTAEIRASLSAWLPFLDTYRTMCLAPDPPFRSILETVRANPKSAAFASA